ncbi:MAG: PilW family protein [Kiritimatiellia bacterium]
MRRAGFTLIELLAAILILSFITTVAGITFTAVLNGWHRATNLADRMQTADYALNQVVAGLRSTYYPTDGNQKDEWGMMLVDNGDGEDPSDSDCLEWTKIGTSMIGSKSAFSETTHRVRMWVEEAKSRDEPGGLKIRVWNPDLFVEDDSARFDEDDYGEELMLVEDVVGFDCQVQKDASEVESDGVPKWAEEWETSNSVPFRVKITFRMKPAEKGDPPLPILRVVEIPAWYLSQNPFSLDSSGKGKKGSDTDGDKGGSNNGGGRRPGGRPGGGPMPGAGGATGGPGGPAPGGGPR